MQLYEINKLSLKPLDEKAFKLESEIQQIFENNLDNIMGLQLVKSECVIKNKRIDSLAFDPVNKAFIIIEYKRDKNVSVIDQGFTYLSLMLENKAEFIVEYNESTNHNLNRNEVDWSQTRVVFVSPSFTENQKLATNFKDIAIELWQVKRFQNNTLLITPIKKTKSAESIKPITKHSKQFQAVQQEIKVYTEDQHLEKGIEQIVELYESLKERMLMTFEENDVEPKKFYIAFKKNNKNILDVQIQKSSLKIWLNASWGVLDDSKKLARNVSEVGHYGNGDYQIMIKDDSNMEYLMSLVKDVINTK